MKSKLRKTKIRQAESQLPKGVTEKIANVDSVKINYKIAGRGPGVVLLHGYAQTSHMWLPLMPLLAKSHRPGGPAIVAFIVDRENLK